MRRAVLLLIFLPFQIAIGQDARPASAALDAKQGHVAGRVADPSDALIPGATVTIHLLKSRVEKTTMTDKVGRFQFEGLAFGQYTISVTRDGFAEFHGKFALSPERVSANLDARLKIATDEEQVDVDTGSDTLDPNNNPDGITLKEKDIETLSDDPAVLLQEVQALSGSPNANIFVDGFSNTPVPPKSMIREIRINQNSYSAKNDTDPVQGMIEILTKAGTDKVRGYFSVSGNDSALNARDRFFPDQPGYHSLGMNGSLSGPVTKASSYFVNGRQFISDNNETISAETLDTNNNEVHVTQTIPSKSRSFDLNPRFDIQLSKNDTLSIRYDITHGTTDKSGAGGFSLPTTGSSSDRLSEMLQVLNSQTIGAKIVNDTRFQYIRQRAAQNPFSAALTIMVQGAFTDGGSPSGHTQDNQDNYELQDYVSVAAHRHYLNFGVRVRSVREANNSSGNYNGEFIFGGGKAPMLDANNNAVPGESETITGLEQYRRTLLKLPGGGASQFSVTVGDPSIAASMTDVGLFFQDDWRWKPNFTLSYGLRYEAQTHISDHRDIAPRLGFAWNFGPKKSPYTLGGGTGFFYHRFGVSSIMTAERGSGIKQQHYILLNPDPSTYPAPPDLSKLIAQTSSSNYEINPDFRAEDVYVADLRLSHSVFKQGRAAIDYWYAGGFHGPLIRNINAPLPGTYDPSDPNSGVRPYGGTNNIFRFDSEGQFRYYRLLPNLSWRSSKGVLISAQYQLVWYTIDDTDGYTANFVSNQYNLKADRGPGSQDTRNAIVLFGIVPLPWHFTTNFNLWAASQRPFNITLGQDLNGDSISLDRPAFATDLTRPSVVATKWGTFDTDPLPSQKIIPFNYGRSPGMFQSSLMVTREFHFGPEQHRPPGMKGPLPRKYSVDCSAISVNPLNHTPLGQPVSTLFSPLFGQSLSSSGSPRELEFQMSLRF